MTVPVGSPGGRCALARKGIQIGFWGAFGLVLLRVTIGWHFLYAGLWKLQQPDFSSEAFLSQAKGPLADQFHAMIPDFNRTEKLDADTQVAAMKDYANRFAAAHKLSDEQQKRLKSVLDRRSVQMEYYLAGTQDGEKVDDSELETIRKELDDYRHDLERLATAKAAPTASVPFQQKRNWDQQSKLRSGSAAWAAQVDSIWDGLKTELADLLDDPREVQSIEHESSTQTIDRVVTYTNVAIGGCLIAGLLTRFAAFGGFLFLLQIVAAQPDWPGLYPEPHPSAGRALFVTKEFVEMVALFALMLLPVGRWAGLDFFIHHLLVRPIYGSRETK